MTVEQFGVQIERLKNVFGEKAFPAERTKLIWFEVKHMADSLFKLVVDRFCGDFKFAPLLSDFRQELAITREKEYRVQKEQQTKDAEEFMKSIYSSDDIKTICKGISDRVSGQMSDTEFESFKKTLNRATNGDKNAILPQ